MTVTAYHLEILTPLGRSFSEEVVHALVPAEDGFVGVLANHADYVTSSPGGRLEVRIPSGETRAFGVGPGFFRVRKNHAFFLTQSVETSPHPNPLPRGEREGLPAGQAG